MFVHCVYFWLRQDLNQADRQRFADGVRSLTTLPSVRFGHVGTPAPTDRPVIERGYSAALVVAFDDEAGHDAYQVHPIHDAFRTGCGKLWTKVQIYDSIG